MNNYLMRINETVIGGWSILVALALYSIAFGILAMMITASGIPVA